MKLYLDSYMTCPQCKCTMEVYKTRYQMPEHWRAICKNCGKIKKWTTGEK